MAETARKTWWALDVAVKVVAIVALLLSLFGLYRWNELGNCLASYNNQASASTGARIEAAERDRKALTDLVSAIANARGATREDAAARVNAAFDVYVRTLAESDRARKDNPPPAPPSQVCS